MSSNSSASSNVWACSGSIVRDLDRWRALTPAERGRFVSALVFLPLVSAGVRLAGFEPVRRVLERTSAGGSGGGDLEAARRVARIVAIAGRRGPVPATCVPIALLTWWYLRRDGITASIRIGVRRRANAFGAHAWVECRGVSLDERAPTEDGFFPFDGDFAAPGTRGA